MCMNINYRSQCQFAKIFIMKNNFYPNNSITKSSMMSGKPPNCKSIKARHYQKNEQSNKMLAKLSSYINADVNISLIY